MDRRITIIRFWLIVSALLLAVSLCPSLAVYVFAWWSFSPIGLMMPPLDTTFACANCTLGVPNQYQIVIAGVIEPTGGDDAGENVWPCGNCNQYNGTYTVTKLDIADYSGIAPPPEVCVWRCSVGATCFCTNRDWTFGGSGPGITDYQNNGKYAANALVLQMFKIFTTDTAMNVNFFRNTDGTACSTLNSILGSFGFATPNAARVTLATWSAVESPPSDCKSFSSKALHSNVVGSTGGNGWGCQLSPGVANYNNTGTTDSDTDITITAL